MGEVGLYFDFFVFTWLNIVIEIRNLLEKLNGREFSIEILIKCFIVIIIMFRFIVDY